MSAGIGQALQDGLKNLTFKLGGEETERKLKALARRSNEYGVDPFGMDLDYVLAAVGPLLWLYKNYFRVRTYGLEKVPRGRVLLVSNHSGQLPIDGAMIGTALLAEANRPRAIRSMVEKWVPTLPYVSVFMARCGQVVGTPQNCIRLLENDEAILVFPEGTRGVNKLFSKRYQLAEFGQGFMRLALETGSPIVPVAVIGAEEQAPALFDLKPAARLLRMPAFPITPTIVPIPLPVRYHIHFGDPMRFTGRPDDDDDELSRKVKQVRSVIQTMVNEGIRARKHVFW
ncbi:lysophospholipid acyltransferase family protein [Vulgatibacter incomptus]|uniref:1-acyl-sn-glycerol-3-phosphate acyltransferase n=1 Tax=Vulgatibacter incomptus TaxID=1391653 RepID=A0A0K1P8C3_9BACT|nr:lysophospholipid acyltransferase family protein [Vulgatibacter incomptus]AKU89681.1 1-acyl-sn-glycerol-3-phosphate acyltransferase [Vulgatibacter incomptus]